MHKKEFSSRTQFKRWIKRAAGIVITAMTISNGVVEINSSMNTFKLLQKVAASEHAPLPTGKYTVEYQHISQEPNDDDISFTGTIVAIGYTAVTADEYVEIGTLPALKQAITNEEYVLLSSKKEPAVSIAIKQPDDPLALEDLIEKLKATNALFIVDNGSGYIEHVYNNGHQLTT